MRAPILLVALALAGAAQADRLIAIPRGGKIPYRFARSEMLLEPSRPDTHYLFLGVGIGKSFDAEIRGERAPGHDGGFTLDLAYNVSAPIPDLAPGLSLGVLDLADATRDGRRAYVAVTVRQSPSGDIFGTTNVELTLGATAGSRNAPFVGVSLPFSERFRVMAEHNGVRLSAGAEFSGPKGLDFRLVLRPHETLLGLATTTRF